MCLHQGEGWLSLGVVGDNIDRDQTGADMMVTTTPILNIDKLDYQYAGLPLGMMATINSSQKMFPKPLVLTY